MIDKTKNGENASIFEVTEIVLVQRNVVGNYYQPKSEVLYIFSPMHIY